MARKRASLKGKGIDVLFGGPPEKPTEDQSTAPTPAEKPQKPKAAKPPTPEAAMASMTADNDLSGLLAETPVETLPVAPVPTMAPLPPESLPVNEADDDEADVTLSENVVDDLGLPVAMEAPPPDLELAMPVAEQPAVAPAIKAAPPILPPESLPVAAEIPPLSPSLASLPAAEPAPALSPPESLPMAEAAPTPLPLKSLPAVEPAPSPPPPVNPLPARIDEADDLSGLMAEEDDLSGLAEEAEAMPATNTFPPANLPPAPPPRTAAPAAVRTPPSPSPMIRGAYYTPPASTSPAPYRPPTSTTTYTARPSTLSTPPSTSTGAPSLSMPRSKIVSTSGFATGKMDIDEKDLAPEETKLAERDYILKVEERAKVDEDEEKAQKVTRYIGRDRRENLDREIESLYDRVASELDRPEEVTAAFRILHEAQDIIFEDARQYDEALYRVSTVKAMIAHKRHLARWSYTWGLFVFFYALVWLIAFFAGLLFRDQLSDALGTSSEMVNVIRSGWLPAVAGGIGGITGILYSLYWRVSKARDFDPQYVMYYLTQPILGFILGAVFYFIIAAGFLTFNRGELLDTFGVTALYVFLGWSAGYRQRAVLETIEKIMRRVLGKSDDSEKKDQTAENTTAPPERTREEMAPPPAEG